MSISAEDLHQIAPHDKGAQDRLKARFDGYDESAGGSSAAVYVSGNPDGTVPAEKGTLGIDTVTGAWYRALDDGFDSWVSVPTSNPEGDGSTISQFGPFVAKGLKTTNIADNITISTVTPAANDIIIESARGVSIDAGEEIAITATSTLQLDAQSIGFFGTSPADRPTGVAVTAAAIHAALVTLGLITA